MASVATKCLPALEVEGEASATQAASEHSEGLNADIDKFMTTAERLNRDIAERSADFATWSGGPGSRRETGSGRSTDALQLTDLKSEQA